MAKIKRRIHLTLAGNPEMTNDEGQPGAKTMKPKKGGPVDDSGNERPASSLQKQQGGNKGPKVKQVKAAAEKVRKARIGKTLQPGDKDIIYDEITTGQTGIIYGVPQAPLVMITDPTVTTLYKKYWTTYDQYRQIRKDPTVALCRAVIAGPILSSQWAVKGSEDADPKIMEFIKDQLVKKRFKIMEKAIYGMIDFGWQGFEKIFEPIDSAAGAGAKKTEKRIGLRKLKPLLQDMTSIMVYLYTGDFAGFRQGIVFVEAPAKAVLCSFRVEGTMWHGYPLLEDVKETVEKWRDVEVGAQRYDRKMAGNHIVVYYPMGKSRYGGALIPNEQIAQQILVGMEASGTMMIPTAGKTFIEGMEQSDEDAASWKVELLESRGGRAVQFTDRLRYLDSLKARAMHIPERAIMEGQFGTKAEAQGHQDILTVLLENLDFSITQEINEQVVDQLVELNFGKDEVGSVWLSSPPISDDKIAFVRETLNTLLGNPSGFMELFPHFDYANMMELVDLPKNKDVKAPTEGGALGQPGGPAAPGVPPGVLQAIQGLGLKPGQPQPLNRLAGLFGNKGGQPGQPAPANGKGGPAKPGQPGQGPQQAQGGPVADPQAPAAPKAPKATEPAPAATEAGKPATKKNGKAPAGKE